MPTLAYLVEIFSALLTPTIAIVTTYIAIQQWRGEKSRHNLNSYDKRIKAYEEVVRYLTVVQQEANVEIADIVRLRIETAQTEFLFGNEVPAYIRELVAHGATLHAAKSEYRDITQPIPPGYDHKDVCDRMHAELVWFNSQDDLVIQKFSDYLRIA